MNPEATEQPAKPRRRTSWVVLIALTAFVVFLVAAMCPPCFDVVILSKVKRELASGYVRTLAEALSAYQREYGDAPPIVGYTKTLGGENTRKIIFMNFDPKLISPTGEYLDPWGTPYKIDVSDPKNPKVYSFGPNKRDDGGTGDDVVSGR